jgi:hypothetical protein
MKNQNNTPPQPTEPHPLPIDKSTSTKDVLGIIVAFLFLVALVVPGMSFLGVVGLIIAAFAASNMYKDAAKTSRSANIALHVFRTIAIIGLSIVILLVVGVMILFAGLSQGRGF